MVITYNILPGNVCLVKAGSNVDFETPLFEKRIHQDLEVNVSSVLEINPKSIFRYLKKLVGEKVNKGDVIAINKGLFTNRKVRSPENGIIKEIDHNQGKLIIETEDKKKGQTLSPFKGEIEKITKESLTINVSKAQEFSLKKAGEDFGGEVFYLNSLSSLSTTEVSKKIIFCEQLSPYLQVKSEALGVKGYITLQELPENTKAFFAQVKNAEDVKKIEKLKYHYCTIVSKSAKIYFYQ
ncbi:hypothetical protein HZA76_01340 [Candidatus Roizmanbacteria bacterium]|nr:hypothetical protein [Candidatus Roizmanbacteria bacterium]